ncbi:alpha/beta fold hydrolase [Microbacterium awajiense]|uniref:Alpha/beta fold hydrolase n=1 Tax=Microbacterium awajiense TaxID=415214 RepID=A0ABP7A0Z9_9MICO
MDTVHIGAVEVDGLHIAYRRAGDGPPLVILHGGLEDSRLWADDLARLAAHTDAIAWDAPGCGRSSAVPDHWSADDWGAAVVDFVDALGLDRPVLAGFSLGSVLALLAARRRPARFGGLVLIGPYAGWSGSLAPEEVAARVAAMRATAQHPVQSWADEFLDTVYPPDADPARRALARAGLDDWRPATTLRLLDAMLVDLRPDLPSIDVPSVVVRGERDERSPRQSALDMVAALPHARFIEIPDAGHDCAGRDLDRVLVDAARHAASGGPGR